VRGGFLDLRKKAASDCLAQRRGVSAEALVHGDDAVADDDAVGFLAVRDVACEFHLRFLSSKANSE
jgi:hypothetical protein